MFRKFQDRVAAAASSVLGSVNNTNGSSINQPDVQRLQALGNYSVGEVEAALHTTGGNVDRAAELLLSQAHSSTTTQHNASTNNYHGSTDEDMDLQRALQQSLDMSQGGTQQQQPPPPRSDIMNQAAEAAMRRADLTKKNATLTKKKVTSATNSTIPKKAVESKIVPERLPVRTKSELLRHHHPDVKLIPKLQDKSIEEQVIRTVDRMKNHPAAIDTLYRAISMIYNNPNDNRKYRRIDTSTVGYQRSVANVPGAADFLRAMKFHNENYNQTSPILVLSDPMYDPALIYLGLSALEQIKLTPEYISSKKLLVFTKDITTLLDTTVPVTSEEVQQRKQYQMLCPKEPADGRGALLQIHITENCTIRRRFDSDDTISDVLHWIGSTVGTVIYNRIIDKTYCLIDVNHVDRIPISIHGPAKHYTLQYIGCWPSGRLQLQPTVLVTTTKASSQVNQEGSVTAVVVEPWNITMNKSRGLASGATSSDDE